MKVLLLLIIFFAACTNPEGKGSNHPNESPDKVDTIKEDTARRDSLK
jgi:hypothetical protein